MQSGERIRALGAVPEYSLSGNRFAGAGVLANRTFSSFSPNCNRPELPAILVKRESDLHDVRRVIPEGMCHPCIHGLAIPFELDATPG